MSQARLFVNKLVRWAANNPNIREDGRRLDAGETMLLQRQAEYMLKKFYDIKVAPNKIRQFFPINNEVPPGARSLIYRQYEDLGEAKIVHKHSDDLPLVNSLGREFTHKVQTLGDAYELTLDDIRAAALEGLPLNARLATACRKVLEKKIDYLGAFGDEAAGIEGLVDHPSVSKVTPDTGGWDTAQPEEIIVDIQKLWNAVETDSEEAHKPNTLLIPSNRWSYITQPRSVDNDTTVLKWLLENLDGVQNIDRWSRLNSIGAGSTPRAMAYERSPENAEVHIPQEFEQRPPQDRNLAFVVNCTVKFAGGVVYYPLSMKYSDAV